MVSKLGLVWVVGDQGGGGGGWRGGVGGKRRYIRVLQRLTRIDVVSIMFFSVIFCFFISPFVVDSPPNKSHFTFVMFGLPAESACSMSVPMLLTVRWRNQPLRVGRRRKQRFLINGFNAYSTPVRTLKRFKIKKKKKETDLRSFAFGLLGFLFCCCCSEGRFVVFLGAADRFRGPLPCHPSKLCKTACRLVSSVSRVISWRNSSQNPSPILTDGWLFSTQPVLNIEDLIFGESIPLRLVGPVILHDRWGGLEEGGSVCRTWHVTLLVKWSGGVGGA